MSKNYALYTNKTFLIKAFRFLTIGLQYVHCLKTIKAYLVKKLIHYLKVVVFIVPQQKENSST